MVRPLLKWAGGKRQLLPALRRYYPPTFNRYIEPFAGSGAVFFDLFSAGRLDGREVSLSDMNPDLIGCYLAVRDHTEAVIAGLGELEREHRSADRATYYDVRDCRFNPQRTAAVHRAGAAGRAALASSYTPGLAAMFIYLNRTGFNGLFRLNRDGDFNVPAGRYARPRICDPAQVRAVARALASERVSLECVAFEEALAGARAGDFVYCDPPYVPLSRTANFAQYTAKGFTAVDHARLVEAVLKAVGRGAVVLLSNSSAPEVEAAYGSRIARQAGLTLQRVPARRAINSRASARGFVDELVITNSPAATTRQVRMLPARPRARRRIA